MEVQGLGFRLVRRGGEPGVAAMIAASCLHLARASTLQRPSAG